ncbi:MAG TPA: hypothetical protein VJS92_16635 [Candidatus Polarisedimenticolaceae bacterium]|nr:hypothetical protein [Candidatus Polarisedimenticolaceae bacterium]
MVKYVLITDDPRRLRHLHAEPVDWYETEFPSAAAALAWERTRQAEGAVALESQGWKFGCVFSAPPPSA